MSDQSRMKVLVVNDTSLQHSAGAYSMRYLLRDLRDAGHKTYKLPGTMNLLSRWRQVERMIEAGRVDAVLINGADVMQNDQVLSILFLELIVKAQAHGCKTALINTIWQNMHPTMTQVEALNHSYVSVREACSYEEAQKWDFGVDMHADLCLQGRVDIGRGNQGHVVDDAVGSFRSEVTGKDLESRKMLIAELGKPNARVYSFDQYANVTDGLRVSYNQLVDDLRLVEKTVFTGSYYDVCAAIQGGSDFFYQETGDADHSVKGLMQMTGCFVPTAPHDHPVEDLGELRDVEFGKNPDITEVFENMDVMLSDYPDFTMEGKWK